MITTTSKSHKDMTAEVNGVENEDNVPLQPNQTENFLIGEIIRNRGEKGLPELNFDDPGQVGTELWKPLRESYVAGLKQAYPDHSQDIEQMAQGLSQEEDYQTYDRETTLKYHRTLTDRLGIGEY